MAFKDETALIDLHIHSNASDGTCSPREIVSEALDAGFFAISITDHDTVSGVCEVMDEKIPASLAFIPGIEISAQPPPQMGISDSIHILGYGFSPRDSALQKTLAELQQARETRNPKIIEKLQEMGIPVSMDDVRRICGTGQPGRPHIARALMEKEVVSSFDEAFDRFLAAGRPAHVDKKRLSCQAAISLINRAGGLAVLAHPGLITLPPDYSAGQMVDDLAAMGLRGIEAFHTDHTPEQTRYFEQMALNRGLLVTGGSDFHGEMKPEVRLGKGNGDLNVPRHHYNTLFNTLTDMHKVPADLTILETNLGYTFTDQGLLAHALRHSSYVNELQENTLTDNQRLEFLGDAVLGLVIGEVLMERSPEMKEGDLSKMRAALVSEPGLATMARQIDLGRFIFLGKGEQLSGGAKKNSILSDTFEAVMAAIYLDLGFKDTAVLIQKLFNEAVEQITCRTVVDDFKSLLQEHVQEQGNNTPNYTIVDERGPDHAKTFEVELSVCDIQATGTGKSKKAAEQDAAETALMRLKKKTPPVSSPDVD